MLGTNHQTNAPIAGFGEVAEHVIEKRPVNRDQRLNAGGGYRFLPRVEIGLCVARPHART